MIGPLEKQAILAMLRETKPAELAAQLVSVQPMDEAGKALGELYELLKANPDKHLVITAKRPQLQADIAEATSEDEE